MGFTTIKSPPFGRLGYCPTRICCLVGFLRGVILASPNFPAPQRTWEGQGVEDCWDEWNEDCEVGAFDSWNGCESSLDGYYGYYGRWLD